MDITMLKDVLTAFADDRSALLVEKGRVLAQIQGELIEATTTLRQGELLVTEDGETLPATRWVAERVAQLPLLADRLSTIFPSNSRFVTPRGLLLDQLEQAPSEDPRPVDDALEATAKFLGRRPAGVCSVLYVTSNAGEGKTTLINELAHRQAVAYRERKTDWLLVPFTLAGNLLLRLDAIIAAGLLNQLRIRRFYIDGFLQLVRLGYIVPALDGFEEVFVETSGEGVSSLGNLINELRGEGTLLIAARTAYFEFKRLDRQARLFDAIPGYEVGFGRLSLERWKKAEFINYCRLAGVTAPEELYENMERRLGSGHALLTRAFFIRRIAELAQTVQGKQFLETVEPQIQDSFRPFVDHILEREVQEKWIDKLNRPAGPLLEVKEHHELLRLLAEEMWTGKRGSLPKSTAEDLAEIYCESRRKSPVITRQVKERLPHHALLLADPNGTSIAFDHDHFREFFLGEQLGEYIRSRSASDIRKLFRVDSISSWTLESAVTLALREGETPERLIHAISQIAMTEGRTSFVRENGGALCIRLAEKGRGVELPPIHSMTLPPDALAERILLGVRFDECYFRQSSVSGQYERVEFRECEFEHLEASDDFRFDGFTFVDCRIHAFTVTRGDHAVDFYDPTVIRSYLIRSGATVRETGLEVIPVADIPEDDEKTKIVRKLLLVFRRATQVSESVIRLRLGIHASVFFDDMRDELLRSGVLQQVKHKGGGTKKRFRLGRSMAAIAKALAAAGGSYHEFLNRIAADRGSADSTAER